MPKIFFLSSSLSKTLTTFFLHAINLMMFNTRKEKRQRTKATYRRISNIYHGFLKFYENKFTLCLKKQHCPLDNGDCKYLVIYVYKQVCRKVLVLYCYFITILSFFIKILKMFNVQVRAEEWYGRT